MSRMLHTLFMLAVLLIGSLYSQGAAAASTGTEPRYGTACGRQTTINAGLVSNCDCFPGLANRIVACVRQTTDRAAQRFFSKNSGFYSFMKKAIGGLITLGVLVYGIMLASGMVEKIGRDSLVLLLKIAFVVWAVQNTFWIYQQLMIMVDSLSSAMFQFNIVEGSPNYACSIKSTVWNRLDCIISSTIGIDVDLSKGGNFLNQNPSLIGNTKAEASQWMNREVINSGLQNGMLGAFFSLMKGSSIGFVIGLIGLISLWQLLMFLIKTLFAFLAAFISLAFMVMMGPIFIPLVLFKVTKQYFDKWITVVISACLQPVILLTFVSFAVAAMDLVLFTGERSITRTIAGNAATARDFNLNKYLYGEILTEPAKNKDGTPILDKNGKQTYTEQRDEDGHIKREKSYLMPSATLGLQHVGTDNIADFAKMRGKVDSAVSVYLTECMDQSITEIRRAVIPDIRGGGAAAPGGTEKCQGKTFEQNFPFDEIDWHKLAAERVPKVVITTEPDDPKVKDPLARSLQRELFASVFLALMVMALMNALMKVVPEIASDLTGDFMYTPNYFNVGGQWSIQQQIANNAGGSVRRAAMTGTRGTPT